MNFYEKAGYHGLSNWYKDLNISFLFKKVDLSISSKETFPSHGTEY